MKEQKNRILVWTSERCQEVGAAWIGGFEEGMLLTVINSEECVQMFLATNKPQDPGSASINPTVYHERKQIQFMTAFNA